jgi:hypothetical protein
LFNSDYLIQDPVYMLYLRVVNSVDCVIYIYQFLRDVKNHSL